jgi:hypothetical protein
MASFWGIGNKMKMDKEEKIKTNKCLTNISKRDRKRMMERLAAAVSSNRKIPLAHLSFPTDFSPLFSLSVD